MNLNPYAISAPTKTPKIVQKVVSETSFTRETIHSRILTNFNPVNFENHNKFYFILNLQRRNALRSEFKNACESKYETPSNFLLKRKASVFSDCE